MVETILASLGATVCLALLVHMFLPAPLRWRIDQGCRRAWQAIRHRRSGPPRPVRRSTLRAAHPPRSGLRPDPRRPGSPATRATDAGTGTQVDPPVDHDILREAEREALAVIERVRRQAREGKPIERDGNVYRPDAFKPRPPKDSLH